VNALLEAGLEIQSFLGSRRSDIEGIVVRQGVGLDWTYIETQLVPLSEAKESPEMLLRLASLRWKIERHP
jgi:hypothetical protein